MDTKHHLGSAGAAHGGLARRLNHLLCGLLFALLAACGGGGGSAPPAPPPTEGSATIGTAGGVVKGPDGVQLAIAADAITADTTFRIAKDATGAPALGGVQAITPIYAITPHGTAFAQSARISIPFDPAAVAPGTQPVLMKAEPGGNWTVLASDVVGNTVNAADTPDLSFFAVGTCFTTRTDNVGPDPLLYCPGAHRLALTLLDGNGVALPAPPADVGNTVPAMTITAPTNLSYRVNWTRPAGTTRSDTIDVWLRGAGLAPNQQPLIGFSTSSNDFTQTFTTTIDPATVPDAGRPGGVVIRVGSTASYTTDALYPGCLCLKPASWAFESAIAVRVIYTGTQPTITQQPQNQAVVEGQTASFSVAATGPNLSYLWKRAVGQQESNAPGANTAATYTAAPTALANRGELYFANVCSNRGTSIERCVNSNAAALNVTALTSPPVFTAQPVSVSVLEGQTASFTASATGLPTPAITWNNIVGQGIFAEYVPVCASTTGGGSATNSSLATCTLPAQTLADSGKRYSAFAQNSAGVVESTIVIVTVTARPTAPVITTPAEPADRSITAGGSVSWTIAATGTAPLHFDWRTLDPSGGLTGGLVCGNTVLTTPATGATLNLTNVPLACNGYRFQAVVSNGVAPNAVSRAALLTVNPAPAAPALTTALADRSVPDGTQVAFNVVATGTPATFTYTWTFDGQPVPGVVSGCTATSASCSFTARLAQTGKLLRVSVANGVAPDATSQATLTVTTTDVAAGFNRQPQSATTVDGGSASFSVGVTGTPTPTVQWQTSTDGLTWTNAGTGTTYAINPATLAMTGLRVRAQATNTIATPAGPQVQTVTSDVVTLTVTPIGAVGMVILAGDIVAGGGGRPVDGLGRNARLDTPEGLVVDGAGNIYVAESNSGKIARIAPNGLVKTIADLPPNAYAQPKALALAPDGSLIAAASNCGLHRIAAPAGPIPDPGTSAVRLPLEGNCPGISLRGVAVSSTGVIHLSLADGNSILRVGAPPSSGSYPVDVWAGALNVFVPAGSADGHGNDARFNTPAGAVFGPNRDLFVADSGNRTIRRITPLGDVTTFAGTAGQSGRTDGIGASARFFSPTDLSFDDAGNLLVLDRGDPSQFPGVAAHSFVRRITPDGTVTTLFDVSAEALALIDPADINGPAFANAVRGMAAMSGRRIALSVGNAVLVRTLP